ncbi:inorganic pyrophosphatase [Hesseltinella vesiculosa]|uniref:Inorganic pyrophosphatase n=1 Tax=Hesseltinella vesiculosa TaxID=101127 RepID=A0A1X2GRT6_9FUNG|nr:inorganic pyrophosphatase [Hesseltinella vesiculosa]
MLRLLTRRSLNSGLGYRALSVKAIDIGTRHTPSHRTFFEQDGKAISPFHDIPLYVDQQDPAVVNMVVEVPRWSNAKIEIATGEKYNPLKQDVKKGKLRFVHNCFPYNGYIWNYGALPQTWEDPTETNSDTQCKGDNDPIDVCEIGSEIGYSGQVKQVKLLGVLALVDEGETDWKVLAIDIKDPMAKQLNDVQDVEKHFPGLVKATRHWFRIYKVPDDKPENKFAFDGECKNKAYATSIVQETHDAWKRLIEGEKPMGKLALENASVESSPYKSAEPVQVSSIHKPMPKDDQVAKADPTWHYIP